MSATESIEARLRNALSSLHSCHRAFSSSPGWTALDDEARAQAEAALAAAEASDLQWVMRAVVICNGHLPQDDFERLRNSFDEEFPDVHVFNDGMIVYTGEDVDSVDEGYPEDLKNCVRWAIEQGFSHVRFDPDGEVISELTDFDW